MNRSPLFALLIAFTVGCGTEDATDDGAAHDSSTTAKQDATTGETPEPNTDDGSSTDDGSTGEPEETGSEEPRVAFEVLQIVTPSEIIVWINAEMTGDEFDALELPEGWFKNQPREAEPDRSQFLRSPDADADGEFTDEEHFGHPWRHNATVVETNVPIDDGGLLTGNRVAKFHAVEFDPGRTLVVLVSPEGDPYVRITRDANRTTDVPTIPEPWRLVEYETLEPVVFDLPNPTFNIRADNEDSYQGPVEELRDAVAEL